MKSSIFGLKTGLAIALTTTIATVVQPQPASAQILEIAAGALNALVRSKQPPQPQPQVIQQQVPVPVPTAPNGPEFNVGTNNGNGNSLHLCISNCLPAGSSPAPSGRYQPPAPHTIVQQRPVVHQGATSSGTVVRQNTGTGSATVQTTQQSSIQSAN